AVTRKSSKRSKLRSAEADGLLARGRRDGFVTFHDVSRAVPVELLSPALIDEVVALLEEEHIDLVETGRGRARTEPGIDISGERSIAPAPPAQSPARDA